MANENDRHRLMAEGLLGHARDASASSDVVEKLHASAQVEATLALVEEVRTLSLATLGASTETGAMAARSLARRRLGL